MANQFASVSSSVIAVVASFSDVIFATRCLGTRRRAIACRAVRCRIRPVETASVLMPLHADQTQRHQFFQCSLYFAVRVTDARFQEPPLDDTFQRVLGAGMAAQISENLASD